MAAWTLPNRITDKSEILATTFDRRSPICFLTIILGMLLGSGRRTVSCWLRTAGAIMSINIAPPLNQPVNLGPLRKTSPPANTFSLRLLTPSLENRNGSQPFSAQL